MDAAAQVARQMWDEVDPDNIADSWARRVPELTQVVTGAQLGVAREADGYVSEALAAQDLADEAVAEIDPAGFAGHASDGRGLMSLLTHPVVVTLLTIQDIRDVARAMRSGRANLDMIVRTQVADAARAADQVSIVSHPAADGYIRQTDGNPCARCLLLSGRFYRWNRGFLRHPNCGCTHVPAGLGAQVPDARQIYDRMSTAQRIRAGFTRAEMQALEEGADIYQVVNARRGVYIAGGRRFTMEGTTRRALAGRRLGRRVPRLTPDQILRDATSREHAQELLFRHGYLIRRPQQVAMPSLPSGAAAAAPTPAEVRRIFAEAQTPDVVSQVLADEYQRLTGRTMVVELRGSVETAREHAEGILRAVERNPEIAITRITTGPTSRAYAETVGTEITFSQRWTSVQRRQDYLEALAADVRSGWHPPGTGSPISVAVHEAGHVLDPHTLRRQIDELIDDVAARTGVARERVVPLGISGYADTHVAELVAEAYSDVVMNGARASNLSKAVIRLVDAAPARGHGGLFAVPLRSTPDLSRLPVARLRAMVQARGITVPVGIRKPALVKLVDDLERGVDPRIARAAAARSVTDERREIGEALIRASELVYNDASERALRHVAGVLRRQSAPEVARTLRPLLEALDAADHARARTAIASVARSARLRQLGGNPGDVVPFRRGEMEWIGQSRGEAAFVVRPGYVTTYEGTQTLVARAAVAPATPEQVAAMARRPAKKAAKKAAPVVATRLPSGFDEFSIHQLRVFAAQRGIANAGKMSKDALIRALNDATPRPGATAFEVRMARATQGPGGVRAAAPLDFAQPEAFRAATDDLVPGLRRTPFEAVGVYRGVEFDAIQRVLREADPATAAAHPLVRAIDAAMGVSPLSTEVLTFRGLSQRGFVRESGLDLGSDLTGATWTSRTYVSTSSDPSIGLLYGSRHDQSPVFMRVVTPEGTRAIAISGGEAELMLQRGLRFRVVADRGIVQTAAGPRRALDVEVVPVAAPAKAAKKAAKAAAPKAPPAPSRMSIPALKTELERAGVTGIPTRVPKAALVDAVAALRAGAPLAEIGARLTPPPKAALAMRGGRAPATAIQTMHRLVDPETGMRTRVFSVSHGENDFSDLRPQFRGWSQVNISITKGAGRSAEDVGYATVLVSPDGRTVYYAELALDAPVQGQGFVTRLMADMFQRYKAAGVQMLGIRANADVGGYAWARAGFRFFDDQARREFADYVRAYARGEPVEWYPPGSEFRDVRRVRLAPEIAAEFLRVADNPVAEPADYLVIGHAGGSKMWPGKEFLLGAFWDGGMVMI